MQTTRCARAVRSTQGSTNRGRSLRVSAQGYNLTRGTGRRNVDISSCSWHSLMCPSHLIYIPHILLNLVPVVVTDRVTDAVQSLLASHPAARLYTTGHSLGAALAVFAAAHLAFGDSPSNPIARHPATRATVSTPSELIPYHVAGENLTVAGVYTYAEPRAGNDQFRTFYRQGTHISWCAGQPPYTPLMPSLCWHGVFRCLLHPPLSDLFRPTFDHCIPPPWTWTSGP